MSAEYLFNLQDFSGFVDVLASFPLMFLNEFCDDFYEALFVFATQDVSAFALVVVEFRHVFVAFKKVEKIQIVYRADARISSEPSLFFGCWASPSESV